MATESSTAQATTPGFWRGSSTRPPLRGVWGRVLTIVILSVVVSGCGPMTPAERVVAIDVSGCGDAFDGRVGGVVVADERVVTVAHGLAQADGISVGWAGQTRVGEVVGYDSRTDLAVVAVPGLEATRVEFGQPASGDRLTLVGGLASGDVDATVDRVLTIRIEEVLGTERVERAGLKLGVVAEIGDSGAGLFDRAGRLGGVVFAVNDDGSAIGWATAASEVATLLGQSPEPWGCDPGRSRLVRLDQG